MSKQENKPITPQDFFYQYELGFKSSPWEVAEDSQQLEDILSRYLGALCMVIGNGGIYTPEQVRYLQGFAAITSNIDGMADKVEPLLEEAAGFLEVDLVSKSAYFTGMKFLQNAGRSMMYDMLRCCEVAGFPEDQMYAISLVADDLGANEFGMLEKIKEQVSLESQLRKKRIKLLFPQGHEMLDDRYAGIHKEN